MEEPNCHISSIQMVITAISGVPSHLTGQMMNQAQKICLMKPSFINVPSTGLPFRNKEASELGLVCSIRFVEN